MEKIFSYFTENEEPTLKGFLEGVTQEQIKSFVLTNYPIALKATKLHSMNPIAILAQGSIESGWGTSFIAENHKNYFGITAYGKPNDYWTGEKYVSKSSGLPFRSYKRPLDSFSDYARLINLKYPQAAKDSFNIKNYAHDIAYSPYLSDKQGDNRPVYNTLIIKNASTIERVLQENNLLRKSKSGSGIFGFFTLLFFGWMGYEFFFNEDEK